MTFTPLFLSELQQPLVLQLPVTHMIFFIPRGIVHLILSSLLFWIVLLLAFQFYKQLYADDEISRFIVVLHVRRAVYCPVTGHKPSGEAGIITEARPSQRHLTSDFSTAVANKGPSRLPVDRDDWGQRKVARFYLQRPSLLRCWHPITVLGDLQHDFLDDAMDKNLTARSVHEGHSSSSTAAVTTVQPGQPAVYQHVF